MSYWSMYRGCMYWILGRTTADEICTGLRWLSLRIVWTSDELQRWSDDRYLDRCTHLWWAETVGTSHGGLGTQWCSSYKISGHFHYCGWLRFCCLLAEAPRSRSRLHRDTPSSGGWGQKWRPLRVEKWQVSNGSCCCLMENKVSNFSRLLTNLTNTPANSLEYERTIN